MGIYLKTRVVGGILRWIFFVVNDIDLLIESKTI
jgi:hypothetical protein